MVNRSPKDFLFNIDFVKYIEILVQQKNFVIVFCTAAVLSSLTFTYVFSERYLAAVNIFYRPVEASLLRQKVNEAFGAPVPTPTFKVIGQTLKDVISSEVILRPVVEELHLDREEKPYYPQWYKRWYHGTKDFMKEYSSKFVLVLKYGRVIEEEPSVKAIIGLRKNIDIKATKESYVFVLSAKDKYPERAAAIVDAVGRTLVEWLKVQAKNPAELKYQALKRQMAQKEDAIRSLTAEREKLLNKLKTVSFREETDKGVKSLYELEQEAERLNAEIMEKKEVIARIEQKMANKKGGYVNPNDLKKMQSDKLFAEIEIDGLTAKLNSIRHSAASMKTKMQGFTSLQNKLDNLEIKIGSYTREHEHLKDLYIEAFEKMANVESVALIMHKATVPSRPVQPIKLYNVGLTLILSLLFSTGLVYVLAYFNIRIFFASKGIAARGSKD